MCFTVRQVHTSRCATAEVATSDMLIYLTTHVDKAVSLLPLANTLASKDFLRQFLASALTNDAYACRHYPALRFACRGVQEV